MAKTREEQYSKWFEEPIFKAIMGLSKSAEERQKIIKALKKFSENRQKRIDMRDLTEFLKEYNKQKQTTLKEMVKCKTQ